MAKVKKSQKETEKANHGIDERIVECDTAYTSGAFKYLRILVHAVGAAQFLYVLYYWDLYVKAPNDNPSKTWGGKFKFLTFLNVILQAVYHSIALLNDVFGSNAIHLQSTPLLRKLRDYIFASFAFPIALNVCISFWVVYAFDRELIFPRALDDFFPNWLNHVVHTNVAMLIIMDLFTCFRSYSVGKSGVTATSSVMFLYICWLHLAQYHNGRWAYPLFDVLNFPMRYFMLFGIAIVSIIFYFVGERLNQILWAPELRILAQKVKIKNLD